MSQSFIEYFIKRVNTLPHASRDLEEVVTTPRTLKRLGLPKDLVYLPGAPVYLISAPNPPANPRRFFLVLRSDTGKHEDWLADYDLEPEPDWGLLCFLNRIRADRGPVL